MGPSKLEQLGWNPEYADASLIPARVLEVQRGGALVATADGEFSAEISGHLQRGLGDSNVCVGDWLLGNFSEKLFWAQRLLPRRNLLERAAAGDTGRIQAMVANIDELWIVNCMDKHFSPELVERYITLGVDAKVTPVLIFTKVDIHPVKHKELQRLGNHSILEVSCISGEGLAAVRTRLHSGKTIALMGSSGVGKSTLVNALLGNDHQLVGKNRAYDGKGKHTTTSRKLLLSPEGACLIDTPGMRSLAPAKAESLDSFGDMDELALQCKFRNCTHDSEPGCALQKAIKENSLSSARFKNFQKLQREQMLRKKKYPK